jgi:hypothetical protein
MLNPIARNLIALCVTLSLTACIASTNPVGPESAAVAGHISAAGPRRVLSLKLVSASEAIRSDAEKKGRPDYPYSFVVYRLEGKNRLLVAQPFKALTGALQKGKLQGESPDNGIFIADEPERIAAALASATDPDLFTQTAVYLRVEAP